MQKIKNENNKNKLINVRDFEKKDCFFIEDVVRFVADRYKTSLFSDFKSFEKYYNIKLLKSNKQTVLDLMKNNNELEYLCFAITNEIFYPKNYSYINYYVFIFNKNKQLEYCFTNGREMNETEIFFNLLSGEKLKENKEKLFNTFKNFKQIKREELFNGYKKNIKNNSEKLERMFEYFSKKFGFKKIDGEELFKNECIESEIHLKSKENRIDVVKYINEKDYHISLSGDVELGNFYIPYINYFLYNDCENSINHKNEAKK